MYRPLPDHVKGLRQIGDARLSPASFLYDWVRIIAVAIGVGVGVDLDIAVIVILIKKNHMLEHKFKPFLIRIRIRIRIRIMTMRTTKATPRATVTERKSKPHIES